MISKDFWSMPDFQKKFHWWSLRFQFSTTNYTKETQRHYKARKHFCWPFFFSGVAWACRMASSDEALFHLAAVVTAAPGFRREAIWTARWSPPPRIDRRVPVQIDRRHLCPLNCIICGVWRRDQSTDMRREHVHCKEVDQLNAYWHTSPPSMRCDHAQTFRAGQKPSQPDSTFFFDTHKGSYSLSSSTEKIHPPLSMTHSNWGSLPNWSLSLSPPSMPLSPPSMPLSLLPLSFSSLSLSDSPYLSLSLSLSLSLPSSLTSLPFSRIK